MIDSSRALSWLNTIEDRSYLKDGDRQLIREIIQSDLSELRIAQVLERLRTEARSSSDRLRTAEIMLYCASIGHWRGRYPQAARDAIEAVIWYDADNHRRAVALWILGTIQWEMSQNHEAYRNWAEARKIFKQFQTSFPRSRMANDWYKERIEQMEIDLVARPEEISTWLNRFERPSLGSRTWWVVNSMREKVRGQAYPSIYVLMQDLQEAIRWSERIYERGEIYLEFGLAMYQMGNSYFSLDLLRRAVSDFYPGVGAYHKQVVARCMLGAVEWMHKGSLSQAAADWLCCFDQFEELRWRADRDNLQEKEDWYAGRREILACALLAGRVKPPQESDLDNDNPTENGREPPASGTNEYKTYPYDDLLSQVLWDRGLADRLIELERKLAPVADRNLLIRRAIERWIREKQ
jgi:hypothetical protein